MCIDLIETKGTEKIQVCQTQTELELRWHEPKWILSLKDLLAQFKISFFVQII